MRTVALVSIALLITACAETEEPMEDAGAAHADSVEMASQQFDETAFDTIQWDSEQAAIDRGGTVWRFSCTKCHGDAGRGDAGFVQGGDTLRPPSFLEPDWQFADDKAALRRQIYTGTEQGGMPHWGLHNLKYRDIDAVAVFIQEIVRLGVEQDDGAGEG